MNRPKIAILGGGFAGVCAARTIGREFDVTLVDRDAAFEWTPNIHEILSGIKATRELTLAYKLLLDAAGHRFLQDEVTKLNPGKLEVHYGSGLVEQYDAIILALGHQPEHYKIRGAEKFTSPFKTIQDVHLLKQKIDETLVNKESQGQLATVTVIGGGFTGIEVVGELHRAYGQNKNMKIQMVEKQDSLLGSRFSSISESVLRLCEQNDIQTYLNANISFFAQNSIHFDDGLKKRLESDITIWTAGTSCSQFTGQKNLGGNPMGLFANEYLQARDNNEEQFDKIFVAGDMASTPTPQANQAYHAMNMGQAAADNCMRSIKNRSLKRYHSQPEIALLSFGALNTYALSTFGGAASPLLAAAKESVFQLQMANLSLGLPVQEQIHEVYQRYLSSVKKLALPQAKNFRPLNLLAKSRLFANASTQQDSMK